ncbi:MAG: UDP binding domain-containing protein [Candidatus Pacebacteria bacterium]|nr:UDP binding domain-containing protein [Candidatus Paceibacterota bacterium]
MLGLTFKENVKDTRNSKVKDVIKKLQEYGVEVYAYGPMVEREEVEKRFNARYLNSLDEAKGAGMEGVILAVLHNDFKAITLEQLKEIMPQNPVLVDVKSWYLKEKPQEKGFIYYAL